MYCQLPMSSVPLHNAAAISRVGLLALPLAFGAEIQTIARGRFKTKSPASTCVSQAVRSRKWYISSTSTSANTTQSRPTCGSCLRNLWLALEHKAKMRYKFIATFCNCSQKKYISHPAR